MTPYFVAGSKRAYSFFALKSTFLFVCGGASGLGGISSLYTFGVVELWMSPQGQVLGVWWPENGL